jgi:hypothetical protein
VKGKVLGVELLRREKVCLTGKNSIAKSDTFKGQMDTDTMLF